MLCHLFSKRLGRWSEFRQQVACGATIQRQKVPHPLSNSHTPTQLKVNAHPSSSDKPPPPPPPCPPPHLQRISNPITSTNSFQAASPSLSISRTPPHTPPQPGSTPGHRRISSHLHLSMRHLGLYICLRLLKSRERCFTFSPRLLIPVSTFFASRTATTQSPIL